MRHIIVVLSLAAVALGLPGPAPIFRDYHEEIGIPAAARIKAAEEALDFDGSRIVGGSPSGLGQFPYMGGLLVQLTRGATSICGCSLLTNTWAVTAAHCWRHSRNQGVSVTVVLGSVRLFSGGTRVTSETVDVHPDYSEFYLTSDIAVIHLEHVEFTAHVHGIALASGPRTYEGEEAYAAGFGVTGGNAGIGPDQVLSHVKLRVISNEVCRRFFGSSIEESTLCTSGLGRRSTCGGDSGGPLVVDEKLIGITSFSSSWGCTSGFPAGFVRVSSFHDWIVSHF